MGRLYEYLHDDDTASLNRWFAGILPPGSYRGFSLVLGETAFSTTLFKGGRQPFSYVDKTITEIPYSLAITRQGVVIQEENDITLTHDTPSAFNRWDTIYLEHTYSDTIEGGNEHSYGIKKGVDGGGKPALDSPLTQIVLGYVYIPADTVSNEFFIYENIPVPTFAARPDIDINSPKGTILVTNKPETLESELEMATRYVNDPEEFKTGLIIVTPDVAADMGIPDAVEQNTSYAIICLNADAPEDTFIKYQVARQVATTFQREFIRFWYDGEWEAWQEQYILETRSLGTFDNSGMSIENYLYTLDATNNPFKNILPTGNYKAIIKHRANAVEDVLNEYHFSVATTRDLDGGGVSSNVISKVTLKSRNLFDDVTVYYTCTDGLWLGATATLLSKGANYKAPINHINGASQASPCFVVKRGDIYKLEGVISIPSGTSILLPFAQIPVSDFYPYISGALHIPAQVKIFDDDNPIENAELSLNQIEITGTNYIIFSIKWLVAARLTGGATNKTVHINLGQFTFFTAP